MPRSRRTGSSPASPGVPARRPAADDAPRCRRRAPVPSAAPFRSCSPRRKGGGRERGGWRTAAALSRYPAAELKAAPWETLQCDPFSLAPCNISRLSVPSRPVSSSAGCPLRRSARSRYHLGTAAVPVPSPIEHLPKVPVFEVLNYRTTLLVLVCVARNFLVCELRCILSGPSRPPSDFASILCPSPRKMCLPAESLISDSLSCATTIVGLGSSAHNFLCRLRN